MSIFDGEATNTDVSAEDLVGEDKRYKSVDELARGRVEADRFIEQIKGENATLREEAAKAAIYKELLDKLGRTDDREAPRESQREPVVETPAPILKDEDLAARIQEALNKERQNDRTQANITEVTNRLLTEFGSDAKASEYVANRARELGVTSDFLKAQAAQAPKAFFKTVGLDVVSSQVSAHVTSSDVNAEALRTANPGGGPKAGSFAFYENMRKTNFDQWISPSVQNQMMKDARIAHDKGVDFFKP